MIEYPGEGCKSGGMKDQKLLLRMLKALANARRLEILRYLRKHGAASVTDVAEHLEISIQSTSKHLDRLSALGILQIRQRSRYVFYRLSLSQQQLVQHILSML